MIVIISRNETLVSRVKYNLAPEGFQFLVIPDYKDSLRVARSRDVRIIIAEISEELAEVTSVFRTLHHKFNCPILAIVRGHYDELAQFVVTGVDDCISDTSEETVLMEHIRALLKRHGVHLWKYPVEEASYSIQDISINPLSREVKRANAILELTSIEFDILLFLVRQAGLSVSREELYKQIWGYGSIYDARLVDVHVCRLRKKIEPDPAHPRLLMAVRGSGYRLKA